MPLTPVFVEKATGDQTAPQVESEFGGIAKDPRLTEYVDFVGRRLLPYSSRKDFPHKFQALESPEIPNAFALGNGNVYVTRGLLDLLDDEAELAEVIGHEMGHVANRHIASQIDAALGVGSLLALAEGIYAYQKKGKVSENSQALIDAANAIIPSVIINGFSRSHEFEADSGGLSYMSKAGYDPAAAVRVFRRFQALEGPKKDEVEIFFRSHPYAADRVKAVQDAIAKGALGGGESFRDRYHSIVHGTGSVGGSGAWLSVPVAVGAAAALVAGAVAVVLSS